MSQEKRPKTPGVGYGKPPEHTRFKKGQSGNPAGRPRKKGPVIVDFDRYLHEPITVMQDGKPQRVHPKFVQLSQALKKATAGDMRAMDYLFRQLNEHGALPFPEPETSGGVVAVPNDIPWTLGEMLLNEFGKPPWSERHIQKLWPLWEQIADEREKQDYERRRSFYGR